MFLKRILLTALGALGLGAFAAGTASAQEIPAPDLFDGQVACSMNVPTPPISLVGQNKDGDDIGITAKIDSGMVINVGTDGDPTFGTPQGDDAGLANILYVIDPNNNNCGAGTYSQAEFDAATTALGSDNEGFAVGDAKPIDAGIAADVGEGYTETLAAFQAVVAADADVEANQSALNTLLEDEVDDDIQTAAIATARENLTKSQGVQTKAHNALYAATGPDRDGSIYRAGVAEWRAKGAVEAAIMSWNEAVSELATADTALTGSSETFGDYVPLQNSTTTAGQILSLITNPADAMSAVNIANVRTYANAEGGTEATQDSTSGAITGTSNFDAAGNLLIPLEDGDSDADTPLTRVKSAQTYTVVNTQLTQVNNVVTALEKLQSDNKNALLQGAIDEAVRRAKLEQAHFQAQFDALVADNTDFDDDTTNGVQSFKTMYDEVRTAMTKRDNAGVTLETAVQTREAATKAVRAAFTNPQSFYQQLVDRRQYVKDQADAEVTRLAGLTGEDAPTEKQTADAAKEASDAAEALTDAQNVHASFQDLIADDSPVKGLVEELLKSNTGEDAGDDGGLLVSAIDGAYDATQANKGEIDTLKAQLTDADGNPIDLTNLGDSEQTATNTGDIEMLDGRVTENEEDIAQIETDLYGATSGQHDGLAACDATGLLNVANCADARSRHNEDEIEDVNDKLMQKKEYIDNLAAEIGVDPVTGEGTGEGGMSRIDMNAQAISDEVKARMEADTMLGGRIDAEEKARMEADMALGGRIDAEEMARMEADTALGGRIDDEAMARMEADTALGGRIDDEEMARADADMALGMRIDEEAMARADADVMLGGMIMAEEMARTEADTMLGGMISAEEMARMEADTALGGRISSNADNIAANMNAIGQNRSAISDNRNMIGELSDDLDVVRAGVAASMALAGMPAINGRGISIGVGSYDGESAFAVGFQIQGEQASFKIGVTSSGGETGASAGVGFNF